MVLHKRLDYGSSGYQVPPMPRVPRFARGKRSIRKKVVDDKQISAFDLLATVAGELLSERENSPPPSKISETITKEKQWNGIRVKAEVFDQGSCNESPLGSESVFKRQVGYTLKDECKPELGIKSPIQVEKRMNGNLMDDNVTVVLEDPMDLDVKPPALVSSDSSIEVPISRSGCFPKFEDGMELVDRDDDENSSVCPHPGTKTAKACRPQRIGDRRIRKLLASKFWKVPQTAFKEGELSNTDAEMKHIYQSRKMFYTRQRTQRSSFKRRKLFERCSMSDISNSLKFGGIKTEETDIQANINGANGASSSSSIQKSSYESVDYKVKFSIKSFKVPELFIEIPENATVGSLKRTVMEAVTAILSGGLRVGVLLQGKKVRDDKQTLLQAGISRSEEVQNLGFTLEPNATQPPPPPSLARSEDANSLLPCASTEPIERNQATAIDQEPTQTSVLNGPESDHDSVRSHIDADSSVDKIDNSKALVAVPGTAAVPMPVVPLRKSRRSELVQRRIRRPFSVAEVEALVQAVEKLGTGRWRDVKIRAFDSAKHRTYVDLKDKWKTLVHTARISPQQRRGEPVPQDLLDRVLAAHAYWSQQQARLQVKPPQADPN